MYEFFSKEKAVFTATQRYHISRKMQVYPVRLLFENSTNKKHTMKGHSFYNRCLMGGGCMGEKKKTPELESIGYKSSGVRVTCCLGK
jgi:hypothetical protein